MFTRWFIGFFDRRRSKLVTFLGMLVIKLIIDDKIYVNKRAKKLIDSNNAVLAQLELTEELMIRNYRGGKSV